MSQCIHKWFHTLYVNFISENWMERIKTTLQINGLYIAHWKENQNPKAKNKTKPGQTNTEKTYTHHTLSIWAKIVIFVIGCVCVCVCKKMFVVSQSVSQTVFFSPSLFHFFTQRQSVGWSFGRSVASSRYMCVRRCVCMISSCCFARSF